MTLEQQKQEERNFLASLGLDDVEIQSDDILEPPEDDAWLLDTLDAMALLRRLGAMADGKAPVLEPPPAGAAGRPPIVNELLNLLDSWDSDKKT